MNMKSLLLQATTAVALLSSAPLPAQQVLFKSQPDQHVHYRIPAIVAQGKTLW